jgi:uncharacterized phage protein (TIGR01671 family)
MREFKFRVWHKGFEKFLSRDEWVLDFDGNLYFRVCDFCSDAGLAKCEEEFVIQQYTGLKDKNNKEIYEGDFVKTYADSFIPQPKYTAGRVEFFNCGFHICQAYFGASSMEDFAWPGGNDIEIIGNIFENPELK